MSDYVRFLGEHRRITVLRILDGAPGYCANDSLLTSACATYGLHATRDQVRGDIAWLAEQGLDPVRATSGLKAWACEMINQVMYDCVQFHGGMGYMRETTVERMSRDARILPIGGGATEVMLEEVAKRLGTD